VARLPFAAWEPDKADLDINVATVATNVLPAANCYMPARGLTPVASSDALPGPPKGMFLAQKSDGEFVNFAAADNGSEDRIYTFEDGVWTDRSKTGGYADADTTSGWQFAQYGDFVYAVSGDNNDIQKIDLTNLAAGFDDVAGTGGTDPPRAKFITVISEFVMLGGLASYPTSVQWSEIGDADGWRIGTGGCDRQEFPDGGLVTGITASEYGLVFQENSIRRFAFNPGSAYVFEFQRIVEKAGTSASQSITRTNARVFWLGEDGFWMEAGGQLVPIGAERVNRYFFADIASANVPYVQGYADPVSQHAYFAYPSLAQSSGDVKDRILCYDYVLDRWTLIEEELYLVGPVAKPDVGIDDEPLASMALEDVPYPLDNPYWRGGRPQPGGIGTDFKLSSFSGDALEATIETGLAALAPPGRSMIQRVAPLIDTSGSFVNVATRNATFDSDSWRTERATSASGFTHWTASGRYHRVRLRVPEGATWTKAVGIDVSGRAEGMY
jgi:hypothetical protein